MLKESVSFIAYSVFELESGTHLVGAPGCFIYSEKILLLFSVIIFAVPFIWTCFPPEPTKLILSHKREFIGNIIGDDLTILRSIGNGN